MINAKLLGLLGILFLGITSQCALAAVDPANDMLDHFYQVTHGFVDQAKKAGMLLLFGLLGIQIAINGIKKLINPAEMEGLISAIIWPLISTTFFAALILLSDTYLPRLIGSFEWLGQQAGSGMELSPSEFVFHGIDVAIQMQDAFQQAIGGGTITVLLNIFPAIFLLFIQIVVVVSFAALGLQMALALINAYFWFCITPILLGFGGLSYTKDMALSALKGGIAVGMKLMVIYFIAAVALRMAPLWGELIGTISLTNFRPFWVVGTSVAMFAYLAFQAPKLAADLLNGTASLTAGDAATNTMMGMAALATAGAGTMAAAQAAKQAGGSALETLGGIAQAGAAGMNSAHDLGKTGMNAVGHAAKEVSSHSGGIVGGSIHDMLDTSSSNMRKGMNESFGGRVAQSIESSRGGNMLPAGEARKNAGEAPAPISGNQSAIPGREGASPDAGSPGFGDASQASLSQGSSSAGSLSNDELGKQLQQLTESWGSQNQPTTADKIRNMAGYVPNDQQSVGVNAQLGGGHE